MIVPILNKIIKGVKGVWQTESFIVLLLLSMNYPKLIWIILIYICMLPTYIVLDNPEWLEDLKYEPFTHRFQCKIILLLSYICILFSAHKLFQ